MNDTSIQGLLYVDSGGRIVVATGVAQDARVRALSTSKEWMAETRGSRLRVLLLGKQKYSVLAVPAEGGDLLVLSDGPEPLLEFIGSIDFAFDILTYLLTDPFEAMTVVDGDGRVVYLSEVHEKFFGLRHGEGLGRPVTSVIENTRLDQVVKSGKAEIGSVQRMNGVERVVSRIPLRRGDKVVGAIGRVMFKGPQQLQEMNRRIAGLQSQVEFYQREAATLRRHSYGLETIIGDSAPTRRMRAEIGKLAPLDTPVLILGESGTGKELIAHALHNLSKRVDGPMVTINTSAMPNSLIEAELFGYESGSFTGADRKGRKGKFEQASGGTIFLDEIGDMPLEMQPKLLRVLQDRTIQRIGGERTFAVDFRAVCATNVNLRNQVTDGKFRLDLYYRISVVTLEAPPLRARLEDIPMLVDHFLQDLAMRHGRAKPEVLDGALDWLMSQRWPGNIRQLRHEIERAFIFCEKDTISPELFASHTFGAPQEALFTVSDVAAATASGGTLKKATEQLEHQAILQALDRYAGNKKRVAQELGISRSHLYKKLEEIEALGRRA
jgi:transcriptional regulator with PAS, ATPase and Fis domain